MKKTIKVLDLLDKVNTALASENISQDEKNALSWLLTSVLHETGNYHGYTYLFDWNALTLSQAESKRYDRQYLKKASLKKLEIKPIVYLACGHGTKDDCQCDLESKCGF
jgi:hypothetical protein